MQSRRNRPASAFQYAVGPAPKRKQNWHPLAAVPRACASRQVATLTRRGAARTVEPSAPARAIRPDLTLRSTGKRPKQTRGPHGTTANVHCTAGAALSLLIVVTASAQNEMEK